MRARWSRSAGRGAVLPVVLVVLALVGAMSGCGADEASMSEAASMELSDQVQQVWSASTAGDVDAARDGLAEIQTTLEALRADGEITADRATRITAAIDDVSRHLALLTTTTVTTPATAPPPTAPSARTPEPTDEESGEDDDDKEDDDRDDEKADDEADTGGKEPKDDNGRGRGGD